LRASVSSTRAPAKARERASFSSSVSWRSTTPARRPASRGAELGAVWLATLVSAAGLALSGAFASGAAGWVLRFFSTTTALVRPWLKLCLTVEMSVFFSDSVLPPGARRVVLSFVSLIQTLRSQALGLRVPSFRA
jgi:hypothetical protein